MFRGRQGWGRGDSLCGGGGGGGGAGGGCAGTLMVGAWHCMGTPPANRMADRLIDTTENITFQQLRWRAVIIRSINLYVYLHSNSASRGNRQVSVGVTKQCLEIFVTSNDFTERWELGNAATANFLLKNFRGVVVSTLTLNAL